MRRVLGIDPTLHTRQSPAYRGFMHQIHADPGLGDLSAMLEHRLSETAEELRPEDLRSLIDPIARSLFGAAMSVIGSDSATIWVADKERTKLTVGFADEEPKLIGQEQPLDKGLISLVLASEHAICENKVYQHAEHSKLIDDALGFITCGMIAVPFYLGGQLSGVISCVQLKKCESDSDPDGFTAAHLSEVQKISKVIERLVNYRIVQLLLDLHT
ncbi:MAG: GAF domain-containing protein [Verrucomicrobiota bacterium]